MIVEALFYAIYAMFFGVFSFIQIPSFPPEFDSALTEFLGYLYYAKNFVNLVFPINLSPYFTIFFSIFGFRYLYPVIMWILRKIPVLGIE